MRCLACRPTPWPLCHCRSKRYLWLLALIDRPLLLAALECSKCGAALP